jgi:hypothetical protein
VDFVEKKKETLYSILLGRTKQRTHWEMEAIVWHATLEMRDKNLSNVLPKGILCFQCFG